MFIAEDDPAAAQRFLDEAEKAFARLAEFPEIGSPRTVSDPSLAGLRLWPVPGFEKFRICPGGSEATNPGEALLLEGTRSGPDREFTEADWEGATANSPGVSRNDV